VDNKMLDAGLRCLRSAEMGNALEFVYGDLGHPSKEMALESYQSDQFGIHGELYAVFGYASLPLFFLLAFFLKRLYVRLRSRSPFILAMKRIVVLSALREDREQLRNGLD